MIEKKGWVRSVVKKVTNFQLGDTIDALIPTIKITYKK